MKFIKDESAQKLRGGYYTEPSIADYLLRWVSEISPRRLLEPSCGDGVFIKAAISSAHLSPKLQVVGVELNAGEARKARSGAPAERVSIVKADFLALAADGFFAEREFDGVVGNPPYIRYQYLTEEAQSLAERIIKSEGLRFTKHTNAWVPFIIASLKALRPGGRLAMVIPAELLSVIHAESARSYLLRECSKIVFVDPEELWFEGSLQGVGLLLAEKKSTRALTALADVGIVRVSGRDFLAQSPEALFQTAPCVGGDTLTGKWTHALLSDQERVVLARVARHPSIHRFSDIASVAVGIVTGANKFFLVPDRTVEEFGLAKHAHPMFGRSEHVAGVIYNDANHNDNKQRGLPANFLWFPSDTGVRLSPGAKRYIAFGESQDLHTRFKCRIRDPWYVVPSVFASPIGMLKRSHEFPRLILNEIDAFTTDTAYRVTSTTVNPWVLVTCFVNSLTALSAELEGRHYGGGVLELVPSEIGRLLVPIAGVSRHDLTALDEALRGGMEPAEVFRIQDRLVLSSLGITEEDIETLRSALLRLRRRRLREGSGEVDLTGDVTESEPRAETAGA